MIRTLVAALAILAVVVLGGELLVSRPASLEQSTAAMPSLEELHAMAGVHKLPLQDVEDQSLIFTNNGANEEARPKP